MLRIRQFTVHLIAALSDARCNPLVLIQRVGMALELAHAFLPYQHYCGSHAAGQAGVHKLPQCDTLMYVRATLASMKTRSMTQAYLRQLYCSHMHVLLA